MKKRSDTLIYAVLYTLYIFAACLVTMFFESLVIRVVDLFVEVPYLGICIIRIVIYTVLVLGILFVLAFREGYKEASFSFPTTAVASVLALIPNFLFSLLFGFQAFISGGVRFITAIIVYGDDLIKPEQLDELGSGYYSLVFLGMGIIYCALIIIAKKLGCKKRLSDREVLTDGKIDSEGNYHYEE